MTDAFEGELDRRTLLQLSALAAGGFAFEGIGTVEAQEDDRLEWSFETGAPIWMQPAVGTDAVYVGDLTGDIHALDAETGDRDWRHTTGEVVRAAPTFANDRVYVGTDSGSVLALTAAAGQEDWEYTTGADQMGGPTVANGVVYAGNTAGDLVALDATTGDHEWTFETDGDMEVGPPIVDGDTVYSGNRDGALYALNAADGTEEWSFGAGDEILVPVRSGDTIYAPSRDGTLYAVDANTGAQQWAYDAGEQLYSAVYESGYVVAGGESQLHAIDVSDQSEAWTTDRGPLIWNYPATADETIYLGDGTEVLALDVADGEQRWSFDAEQSVNEAGPTFADGTVYIGSSEFAGQQNRVYALDAETDEDDEPEVVPDITGFQPVQINGLLYGQGDEELPEGVASEWADAHAETVTVVNADSGSDVTAQLFRKVVGPTLYIGVRVSSDEVAGTDSLSASQLSQFNVYVDRTGTDGLSNGDVRLVGTPVTAGGNGEEPDAAGGIEAVRWEFFVFLNGEFEEFAPEDGQEPFGSMMAADLEDGGFGIEGRVDTRALDERLEGDTPEGEFRTDVDFVAGQAHWGVGHNPDDDVQPWEIEGKADADQIEMPEDNSSIDRVEITQSVQDETNSVTLVQGVDTLARVFVDHPEPGPVDVNIRLTAYKRVEPSPFPKNECIGEEWILGHTALPQPLDRENKSDSANLELPPSWLERDGAPASLSPNLTVFAEVHRPKHIDQPRPDRKDDSGYLVLEESIEKKVFVSRLLDGTGDAISQAPQQELTDQKNGFERMVPISEVQWVELSPHQIGPQPNTDNGELLQALVNFANSVDNIGDANPLYGVTTRGGGLGRTGTNATKAAWGNSSSTSRNLVMAHELNHTIGDPDTWARHTGSNCPNSNGPFDPNYGSGTTDDEVNEIGWDPGRGIVPDDHPEILSYCQDSSPVKWISVYRWEKMVDEWRSLANQEPVSATAGRRAETATSSSATARVLTGFLYADGSGELDPSFEIPGTADFPEPAVDDPQATLVVDYGDTSQEIPVEVSFEVSEGHESGEKAVYSFRVPDDGEITGIMLRDADTDELLDEHVGTDYELTTAELSAPESFDREQDYTLDVTVESDAAGQLYRQLFFRGADGTWLPWGNQFTGDSVDVRFTVEPGGTDAQFLLLVSDSVNTKQATSSTFELPPLPPTVEIPRGQRWIVEYEDGDGEADVAGSREDAVDDVEVANRENVGGTVEGTVGAQLAIDVRAHQRGERLPAENIEWTVDGGEIEPNGSAVGTQFRHRFSRPGSYTVSVSGTDPETNLSTTDEIDVEIGDPPLPDESTLRQFRGEGPPPVVGEDPPQDLNGDGLYRDVDGSGEFSIADVQAFFQNRNSDAVQNNPEFFNFDGGDPAEVTIGDVQALFADLVEGDSAASDLDVDPHDLSAEELASLLGDE